MNTAIISGRLVRDPGYNETQNEKGLHKIAKFVLAVRRNYSDDVSFIPVKAFAKKAEFVRDCRATFYGFQKIHNRNKLFSLNANY